MYTLETKASFDSAHFLWGYEGKCSNIHGHRWTIKVSICGDELDEDKQTRGMLVDFGTLKNDVKELADSLDHCLIIEKGSLKDKTKDALMEENFKIVELPFRPTAENLAKYVYYAMAAKGYKVLTAYVYETPNNVAAYSE